MNEVRSRLILEYPSYSFMFQAKRKSPMLEVDSGNLLVSCAYLLREGMIVRGYDLIPMPENIPWSTEYEHI